MARILSLQPLLKELLKIRMRIKYGAREELFPLLKLRGIGRVRARKLYSNNIRDVGAIKKAGSGQLSQILGERVAKSVIEQVTSNRSSESKKGPQSYIDEY
jgi:helicase